MPFADPVQERDYHRSYMRTYLSDPKKRAHVNRVANDRIRKVKEWINKYKLSYGCLDCGYRQHAAALDFDHMDGKTSNIANLKSISAVQAEIERHACVVRCANCHRIKSWAAMNNLPYPLET